MGDGADDAEDQAIREMLEIDTIIYAALEALGMIDDALSPQQAINLAGAMHAIRSALSTPPAAMEGGTEAGWRPIESAPKGEPILTLMKHGVIEGIWNGEECEGYYWQSITWYPTHWMPLPAPPAAPLTQQKGSE